MKTLNMKFPNRPDNYGFESICLVDDNFNLHSFINYILYHNKQTFKKENNKLYYQNEEFEFQLSTIKPLNNNEEDYSTCVELIDCLINWNEDLS